MTFRMLTCFLLFGLLILDNNASACSCSRGARLVKDEVKRSSLVIIGKVVSIEKLKVEIKDSTILSEIDREAFFHKITFLVFTLFKGKKKGQKVVVYTGLGGGDCGFPFVVGKQYILYGNKNALPFLRAKKVLPKGLQKAYWTDICTRTQSFNSKENLALRLNSRHIWENKRKN